MKATEYSTVNAAFSEEAHMAARKLIYPSLFGCACESLTFEEDTLVASGERGQLLDGEMGIDRIVHVTNAALHQPVRFTVQERFRRPTYCSYRDLTITAWNHASGLPSELYKITADIFVYAYYDHEKNKFTDGIAVAMGPLKLAIVRNEIAFSREHNKKNQDFFAFGFAELVRRGVVVSNRERHMTEATPQTLTLVAALADHLQITKTAVIEAAIAHYADEQLPVRVDIERFPAADASAA